jgi:dolichyl-diphosphooligosaccharide--protein glycosyltransferase
VRELFDSLRHSEYVPNVFIPEQYFVVSWDNLMLSKWISRFGTWSLTEGETKGGKLFSPPSRDTEFDLERGLMLSGDRVYSLSGMILVMDDGSTRRYAWAGGAEAYCVANRMTGQIYVMDATIFESMMVRMLLDDPAEFQEHFELVVDRSPWARAYRVK